MRKKELLVTTLAVAASFLVLAAILLYVFFFKPHRSVENEDAVRVTALQLFHDFETNEAQANKNYLDKAVEVVGVISETTMDMERKQVLVLSTDNIMFGVRCTLREADGTWQTGDSVTVKGICKGFLSDVVVTDGIVKK